MDEWKKSEILSQSPVKLSVASQQEYQGSLLARAALFQWFAKMTNTKGREEALDPCSLGLTGNMELFLWPRPGETTRVIDIKGMCTVQKRCPINVTMAKLGESTISLSMLLSALLLISKGKIFANRINVCIEHIKHSKGQDSFLKWVKENNQRKYEAKEREPAFNWSTSPFHPEKYIVRTDRKEFELLEHVPCEFMAYCTNRNKRPKVLKYFS